MVCHALAWNPFAKIIQGFWSGLVCLGLVGNIIPGNVLPIFGLTKMA